MIFKTKNGIFVTNEQFSNSGLAIAFNIENFLLKVNKLNGESWKPETLSLIQGKIHTVLAQYDADNETYKGRMLNAGGILTFVTPENEGSKPLGIMLTREKGGLQLGFGKVELKDLDEKLSGLQARLDNKLKSILSTIVNEATSKDELIAQIKGNDILDKFSELENILTVASKEITGIISDLSSNESLNELRSSFGRPPLNKLAVKAIKAAAIREITEEIEFKTSHENPNQLSIRDSINREAATEYVKSLLVVKDKSKFSAKEFNNDFESTTFVVTSAINQNELKELTPSQSCLLVQPNEITIKVVNEDKGMLQTSIQGYPPILGGGNQYTVALFCKNIFAKDAVLTSDNAAIKSTLFSPASGEASVPTTAAATQLKPPH